MLTPPALANSVIISTISNNRGDVTELSITANNLAVAIGDSTGYNLLATFVGSNFWTNADPFSSFTDSTFKEQVIDCKCVSSTAPISINSGTPFTDAKCKRRISGGAAPFNAFAILINFNAAVNNNIRCFFPEFKLTQGYDLTIELKAIIGDSYIPTLDTGAPYGGVYRTTSNTISMTGAVPGTVTTAATTFA